MTFFHIHPMQLDLSNKICESARRHMGRPAFTCEFGDPLQESVIFSNYSTWLVDSIPYVSNNLFYGPGGLDPLDNSLVDLGSSVGRWVNHHPIGKSRPRRVIVLKLVPLTCNLIQLHGVCWKPIYWED